MRIIFLVAFIFSTLSGISGNEFPVSAKYRNDKPNNSSEFKSPDFPGWLVVDIGFNSLSGNDDKMNIGFIASRSFGIYHMNTYELGKKLVLNASIGLTTDKLNFKRDFTLDYIENTLSGQMVTTIDSLTNSPSKNLLAMTYLELPLEFRYYPSGSAADGGFFVALGGMAGLRINSHTKVKGEENDRKYTNKMKDDFGLNTFRYGVTARIGFRGASLYYKRYLSNTFGSGAMPQNSTFNPTMSTIGLSIALF